LIPSKGQTLSPPIGKAEEWTPNREGKRDGDEGGPRKGPRGGSL